MIGVLNLLWTIFLVQVKTPAKKQPAKPVAPVQKSSSASSSDEEPKVKVPAKSAAKGQAQPKLTGPVKQQKKPMKESSSDSESK